MIIYGAACRPIWVRQAAGWHLALANC
jgi:glyoxylase-like metal-dependent hydrolase (beta-lactamase superfamily II)